MQEPSFINFSNLALIEELYTKYLNDASSLEPTWRAFFDGMNFAPKGVSKEEKSLALNTYLFITAFRHFGHLAARTNPLFTRGDSLPDLLDPHNYGLNDLSQSVPTFDVLKEKVAPLSALFQKLKEIYTGNLGYEFTNLFDPRKMHMVQELIEKTPFITLSQEEKERTYRFLAKAEALEAVLHMKYVGQKRFSLEGAESLIPLLDTAFQQLVEKQTQEVVIGMAHRGRLSVLANILQKECSVLFSEFEENYIPSVPGISGDVKYHKGYSHDYPTASGKTLKLTLANNPSHLESVGSVVLGIVKAKEQLLYRDRKHRGIVPILIHGDAALAGQGIVYESLQLTHINGYDTGGAIHLVINNQIGFTTLPKESRSTFYCTDIAKCFSAPVIHVNAEDVAACLHAARLAIEIRLHLQCDVFIDLICYRKYGHNEGDEPAFTQPSQYATIRQKESIASLFKQQLLSEGLQEERLHSIYKETLDSFKATSAKPEVIPPPPLEKTDSLPLPTHEKLLSLTQILTTLPENLSPHPKVERLYKERLAMVQDKEKKTVDWALAELLSFAHLLDNGVSIRLSGQDSIRGTFSQRHAAIIDMNNEMRGFPLEKAAQHGAFFQALNSPLSEFAVLGFEYGFSLAAKRALTLWEAQYGDFANSAQVIIDQYISGGKQKWNVDSNLTLLLPHGYEGMGPEHSSARIERYLQLCAEKNLRIALPTTAAQYFHLLNAQAFSKIPCIIFTPKAMLRHPDWMSAPKELSQGSFQPLLYDKEEIRKAKTLIFSTGKIYYDVATEKNKRKKNDIAQIRLEQLYPLETAQIETILSEAPLATTVLLIQDEPANMGALPFLERAFFPLFEKRKLSFKTVCRDASASTAAGSLFIHKKQQAALIARVFDEA